VTLFITSTIKAVYDDAQSSIGQSLYTL